MGDLAQALVDLGQTAERRRHARSQLRKSVPVVADSIVKMLRAGDEAALTVDRDGDEIAVCYRVDMIYWNVQRSPGSPALKCPQCVAALVRYPGVRSFAEIAEAWEGSIQGAVIGDPRIDIDDPILLERLGVDPDGPALKPATRAVFRLKGSGEAAEFVPIHLGSDDELLLFADEAERVVAAFIETFEHDAERMAEAADAITRLVVR